MATYTRQMAEAYPRDFNVAIDPLVNAIEAIMACEQACTSCADSCLSESDSNPMRKCIRLDLDCADICAATSRVLSRHTEYDAHITRQLLEACIQACMSCAEECERHSAMDHCRICAEACRHCAEACRALMAAMHEPQAPSPAGVQ